MSDDAWSDFSQRLACEGDWLVEVEPLVLSDDERVMTGYAERNLSALTFMDVFEERRSEPADEESPLEQDLARMDAKLNALIQIVNRMLVPDLGTRTRVPMRFNADGALIPPGLLAVDATTVLLRIRFDACPSLPLELPARRQPGPVDGSAFLVFEGVTEGLREGLERLVFRHHRRRVAVARHGLASQA